MTSTSRLASCAGTALLLAVVAQTASAAAPRADGLRAAALGPIVDAPNGRDVMELVRFDENVVASLLALTPGESMRVEGWPVAPGERRSVVVRRVEIYSQDARIVAIGAAGETELPRSRRVFFQGAVDDPAPSDTVVALSIDPVSTELSASVTDRTSLVEIRSRIGKGRLTHVVAASEALRPEGAPELRTGCSEDVDARPLEESARRSERAFTRTAPSTPDSFTRYTVVAVDTDNEFMQLKFADNTANAVTYIANLFNEMNTQAYDRPSGVNPGLRLVQGYTILRLSSASDPYTQAPTSTPSPSCPTCNATNSAQLTEFRTYWQANYAPIQRALTMMLSGKQLPVNSASGIAGVPGADDICGSSSSYSFNQVFKFTEQTALNDVRVNAHELGHNLGSPHTHCYADPAPDRCFNGEACYAGATNCPGGGGTLMSYCHLTGCGATLQFHADSLTRYIDARMANSPSCVFSGSSLPAAPTISVSGVSPATGVLAGGGTVTITGTNFVNGATVTFVELPSNNVFDNAGGGTEPGAKFASPVTFNSSTSLTATVPSAANAGLVDVIVQNPDQQTGTLRNGYTYTAAPPAPTVTAVTPNFGPAASTTPVTITGTGFAAGPSLGVTFGGTAATGVAVSNATTITATAPAHAAGLVNVVVTNGDGQTGTLTNGFFYAPAATATLWHPLTPCRVIDTRNANGPLGGPALAANGTRSFTVTGTCGVPVTAKSVTVNYTVTQGTAAGELRAFAGDALWTGPSVISFKVGATKANNGHLLLSTNGAGAFQVTNASAATIHFILDVNGYYE